MQQGRERQMTRPIVVLVAAVVAVACPGAVADGPPQPEAHCSIGSPPNGAQLQMGTALQYTSTHSPHFDATDEDVALPVSCMVSAYHILPAFGAQLTWSPNPGAYSLEQHLRVEVGTDPSTIYSNGTVPFIVPGFYVAYAQTYALAVNTDNPGGITHLASTVHSIQLMPRQRGAAPEAPADAAPAPDLGSD
jgi:hypothetical protein